MAIAQELQRNANIRSGALKRLGGITATALNARVAFTPLVDHGKRDGRLLAE